VPAFETEGLIELLLRPQFWPISSTALKLGSDAADIADH